MIPELGHFALIVALLIALVQGTLPIVGAQRGMRDWTALARPAAQVQFVLVAFAFACLAHAFVVNDFSVAVVATHSNSQLPLSYRFAATWGSHEGSMLLWVLILAGWAAAVSVFDRQLPTAMTARILGILGLLGVGFLTFLLLTSNPFHRLLPAAVEGRDLNPVLQDFGMVVHPPMLYMGYVGFGVAFAFALAALLDDTPRADWARWSRPWATAAWCFLTSGIALGSWWAYRVLGWGGWWFWDPVENASFVPWLVGTALIHSLAVTDRRGAFRSWTVLLAIGAFSSSLLGTFLVRSGVLSSVHAFANDPKRGVFLLAFLIVVIGGSLALFAWRAPRLGLGGRFDRVSRETLLLANNLLLMVAAGSVLLGTLYPLVLDALDLGKISVGPPYFEAVFAPVAVALVFLMGIGPLARWKAARVPDLATRVRWAFAVSLATGLLLPSTLGGGSAWVSVGLCSAAWIVSTSALNLAERVRSAAPGLATRLAAQPRGYYGMLAAHCGLAVFIVGVTLVKGYETEHDLRMNRGEDVTIDGTTFRLTGAEALVGPNYSGTRGAVDVFRHGALIDTLYPEKRLFHAQGATTTEAAIRREPFGDVYVSLGEPLGNGAWSVRLYSKPFVAWIWGGCLVMAFGGLLALTDRRYRRSVHRVAVLGPRAA